MPSSFDSNLPENIKFSKKPSKSSSLYLITIHNYFIVYSRKKEKIIDLSNSLNDLFI